MKKNVPLGLALIILLNANVNAQHLNYSDKQDGDIIMNEVQVANTTPCSYWETMGWNVGGQGGAYCGVQQQNTYTNFIFSIWDPIGVQLPITAPYVISTGKVNAFGGEGTGLHYDDKGSIGWKLNTWVRTVSRRWDYNGHSFFGFWTYDYAKTKWTHHVTMDFPVANVKFNNGGTNSFLEDWCSSPQNYRKGLYGNGYKRNMSGTWIPFKSASYSGNGTSASDAVANGGIQNGSFFMEYGGNTTKKVTNGQIFNINLPATPVLTVGQIASTSVYYKPDSLSVSWVTDDSKSPQFSYTIKVINSAGTVVITKTDIVPHLRKLTFNVKSLASGTYTVRVSMLDIFDQMSNEIDKTVVIGGATGVDDQLGEANDFTIYPNPCNGIANIFFSASKVQEAILFIYDVTGRAVISDVLVTVAENTLDVSALHNGIYFVRVYDKQKNILQNAKLIKESNY